ncbi:MAG TPA: hypothetical protein VGQ55_10085 [Pyrinomonadaceae bacterium]|jgi:hypothetical protein|nr:hypothetical protein [Pyrinomonadaceae bacterium]
MRFVLPILIAITTLVSVPIVFGQSHQITEAELTKLNTEATAKRKGLPLREKNTTTGYNPGASSETLYEFGPNNTYHYLSIKRANGVETKTEGIRIGDVRYTRRQDGSWIKELPQGKVSGGSGIGNSANSSAPPETTTEYLYIGSEKIHDQRAAHYRKIHVVKFISRMPVLTRKVVNDYWFRADGMLVKESLEDVFENPNRSYKSVTEYEYNKDIKITAPIPD